MSDVPPPRRTPLRRKLGLAALGLAALAALARHLPDWHLLIGWADWLGAHPFLGGGLYCLVFVLWGLVLPKGPMAILGGAAFGMVYGFVLIYLGTTITLAAAFFLARRWGRMRVRGWLARRPWLAACDHALAREGGRVVVLLRLSPVIPAQVQNVLYGVSRLPFRTCVIGTWIGILPYTLTCAGIGFVAARGDTLGHGLGRGLAIAGVIATAIAGVLLTRRARRVLHELAVDPPAPAPVAIAG